MEKQILEIVSLIHHGKITEAYEKLPGSLIEKCKRLIIKNGRGQLGDSEALSIFFNAFEVFCNQVVKKNFVYQTDAGFESYLKEVSKSSLAKYLKEVTGKEYLRPVDELEMYSDEVNEEIDRVRKNTVKRKKEKYAIDLKNEKITFQEFTKSYGLLSDECKLLIVLKLFFNHSHDEIVDKLKHIYDIKNSHVSRTKLYNCLKKIRV